MYVCAGTQAHLLAGSHANWVECLHLASITSLGSFWNLCSQSNITCALECEPKFTCLVWIQGSTSASSLRRCAQWYCSARCFQGMVKSPMPRLKLYTQPSTSLPYWFSDIGLPSNGFVTISLVLHFWWTTTIYRKDQGFTMYHYEDHQQEP